MTVPILILLFFFSLPILSVAPELLPVVTINWLYSWVPFRFIVESFKDILFFGKKSFDHGLGILGWSGVVSLMLMFLAVLKSKNGVNEAESQLSIDSQK
ncbi:hypothetical protein ACSVDA_02110 [Cytobacillus sp. Hm23]